jgi:hypothetical protein
LRVLLAAELEWVKPNVPHFGSIYVDDFELVAMPAMMVGDGEERRRQLQQG